MRYRLIYIIICLVSFHTSPAQIMKTINDAPKLKIEEQKFIGQPLKALLNEIKPPIKMFWQREGWAEAVNCLMFHFVSYDAYRKATNHPTVVIVYFKDNFIINTGDKTKEEKFLWTEEYAKKYGEYKIIALNVYGND